MNWTAPQVFTAIARDGKTEIYGALWKPSNFDPNIKYPVIDNSYTGPHTQMFPRNFARVLAVNNQALAELGFVVMMVDGLGSSGRSKAFHDVSYKNMGLSLTDHVLAIQQRVAAKYAWIDAERVGIFGHSAGGYDAGHALLQFPDFYKVRCQFGRPRPPNGKSLVARNVHGLAGRFGLPQTVERYIGSQSERTNCCLFTAGIDGKM